MLAVKETRATTKLDEIINKLCSQGVEYVEFGKIVNFRRGSFPQQYVNKD